MALKCAKTGHLGQTTQNTVQNFEFFSFWRGKLHLDRWNKQTSQSYSNSLLVFVIWTPNITSQTGLKQIRVNRSPNKKLCLVSTNSSTAHSDVNICIPFLINSFSTPDIHKSLLAQFQSSEYTPCASRLLYLCHPNSTLLQQVFQGRSIIDPFYFNLLQQLLDSMNNKNYFS